MQLNLGLNKRAFCLIELIFSFMITILILSYAVSFTFRINNLGKLTSDKTKNFIEIFQALNIICKDIRLSKFVSSSSTSTKIILLIGSETITYEFISGKIKRIKNSFGQYITNENAIKDLKFSYPKDNLVKIEIISKNGTIIKIEITLRNYL